MKAFIIEDEIMAIDVLSGTIRNLFPDISIAGTARSVADAVKWLGDPANAADLIFMDVELLDGKCFEIFKQVKISAPVIMTTAYDNYAVTAFEVNSVDYLLKPVEPAALRRAVDRARSQINASQPTWKEAIIVKYGDHLVPVKADQISYIYSGDKYNHIVTFAGEQYMIEDSLDAVAAKLDPGQFFKISRSGIVSRKAVGSLTKLPGSRLRLTLDCKLAASPEVSRSHTDAFLAWLDK